MFRFSPQVIPFLLTIAGMFFALQGAFVGFVYAWYDETYRQVEFVMERWEDNAGSPYVAGTWNGSGEPPPFQLPGAVVGGRRVLQEAPAIPFEAGRIVKVWYSPDAPLTSWNGESANAVPVEAVPVRPGWGRVLGSLAMTLAVAVAGFFATVFVANRWARQGSVT